MFYGVRFDFFFFALSQTSQFIRCQIDGDKLLLFFFHSLNIQSMFWIFHQQCNLHTLKLNHRMTLTPIEQKQKTDRKLLLILNIANHIRKQSSKTKQFTNKKNH